MSFVTVSDLDIYYNCVAKCEYIYIIVDWSCILFTFVYKFILDPGLEASYRVPMCGDYILPVACSLATWRNSKCYTWWMPKESNGHVNEMWICFTRNRSNESWTRRRSLSSPIYYMASRLFGNSVSLHINGGWYLHWPRRITNNRYWSNTSSW